MKKRVVIAGFGDAGILTAIYLGNDYEVVGITPKPCLVSGQELGTRLTRLENWKANYLVDYHRYKKLDGVNIIQGLIESVDSKEQTVSVRKHDGEIEQIEYDVLVIASGATNGFWRDNAIETKEQIENHLKQYQQDIVAAKRIAVIGGGATGVSVSSNISEVYPEKEVSLFYSQAQPLPGYHAKVRTNIESKLKAQGVKLYANHRASIPEGFACDRFTYEPVEWSTGQPAFEAGLVIWATGKRQPNNQFIPAKMLNDQGYVKTDKHLCVSGYDNVFAIGDIAQSDKNRSSARNWGYRIVANNIRAYLQGKPQKMKDYSAPEFRWGSILGVQNDGMRVYQPDGGSYRFTPWVTRMLIFPLAVRKAIYKGMRG